MKENVQIFFTTCQTKFDRKGFAKDVLFFVTNWMIVCDQFILNISLTKCFSLQQQKRPLILTYSTYLDNKCTRKLFCFHSVSSITQISEFTVPIWWLIWMLNICLYHPIKKDLFAKDMAKGRVLHTFVGSIKLLVMDLKTRQNFFFLLIRNKSFIYEKKIYFREFFRNHF